MTGRTEKALVQCPKCKGFSLNQDANYRVNEDQFTTYDNISCETCGYDGSQWLEHTVPIDFDYETDTLP